MSQFFIIFKCGYWKHKPNANRSSASSGIDVTEGAGTVCWALTAREPQHIDLNDVKIPDIRCPTNFRETGRVFHAAKLAWPREVRIPLLGEHCASRSRSPDQAQFADCDHHGARDLVVVRISATHCDKRGMSIQRSLPDWIKPVFDGQTHSISHRRARRPVGVEWS